MSFHWRDLVGSLVGGNHRLTEYLGEVGNHGLFAAERGSDSSIVRLVNIDNAEELQQQQWVDAVTLQHPALAKMLEAGQADLDEYTYVYAVAERPDDNLAEVVATRALTTGEAREVVNSVLQGLSYLHAQGFVHGGISPDNIVAVGDTIKLSPWSIAKAGPSEMSADLKPLGQTIVEILRQRKPQQQTLADMTSLPSPFRQVAKECGKIGCTVEDAQRAFSGEEPQFLVEKPAPRKMPVAAIVGSLAALLVLVFGVRAFTHRTPPPESTRERATVAHSQPQTLPSPLAPDLKAPAPRLDLKDAEQKNVDQKKVEQKNIPPKNVVSKEPVQKKQETPAKHAKLETPKPPEPDVKAKKEGDWAVVAAIYNSYDLAKNRADSMSRKSRRLQPEVFPDPGKGKQYMVVLGYSDSRKEAEQILRRAHAEGMPSDTYVTRLSR